MSAEQAPKATAGVLARPLVRITNNFIHDTCTGLWFACVIVIYTLAGQMPGLPPEAAVALASTQSLIWRLLVIALVGLAATGAIRLFYWRLQATAEELSAKRAALIWKHVAFLVIYGVGTAWAYRLAFPSA